MTTGLNINQPRRSKGRHTNTATQDAQWQFQANLLDQLSDAVIAVDLEERITYLNRAAVAQYGVEPGSAIGQPLSYVYRHEWLQPEDELLADAALAQQGQWQGENRHIRQDGSTLYVESRVTVLRDAAGNATGLLATIRDITDRKQMERMLRASELRYRRLADTMPQLVWTANVNGVVDYYNIHVHDFDPTVWQGVAGFDWESLIHPEDRGATLTAWARAMAQRQTYSCEQRLHMADGSWRWHLSRAVLLQDPDQGLKWYGTATDIHERKMAEEALRTSEERYRQIFDQTAVGINQATVDGQMLAVNPGFCRLLGYSAEELLAVNIFDLTHPDDRALTLYRLEEAKRRERDSYTVEKRLLHKDGRAIWVSVTATAVRAATGDILFGVAITQDITARKQAEDDLRANEAQLQTILQNIPVSVYLLTPDQRYLYVNRHYEQLAGITNAEIRGKAITDLFDPATAVALAANDQRALAAKAPIALEEFAAQDGVIHTYASIKAPLLNAAGEPYALLGISTDITDRKQTEDALRASEARFRTLANTVPSIIWTAAPDGTITYANDQWFDYCGVTPEANARHWPQLVLHPDDFDRCVTQWSDALESGDPYEIEVRNRRYDGVYRWFLTRATPLRDTAGHITAWFGVTTDIEERKQAELAQQFLFDLDAQLRLLDDVAAILATATERLGHYLGVTHCTVNEIDLAADQGRVLAHWRCHPDLPPLTGAHALSTHVGSAIAEALASGQSIAVADVAHDPRTKALVPLCQRFGVQSIMCAPFRLKGTLLAVLSVADAQPRSWHPQEVRLVESVLAGIWPLVIKARAEEQLSHSEERLRLATEAGGVGIFDHNLITNQTVISELYAQITGLPTDAVVTREAWLACVHPEDRPLVEGIWQAAQATGASYYYECRLIRPDGALVWIEVNAWVTPDEVGRGIRITGAVRDITERKQAALHQQFLLDLNSALRTPTDADTIQQAVVERLGEYLGADRCRFNAVDLAADKSTLLAAWSRPGLPPPSDINPLSALASAAYIASAQAGHTLAIQDANQDERNEIAKALLLAHGFAATIRVPCLREGQWVASLHVLQTTARHWRPDEVQLVENVVHHFWPLVEKARVEAELRRQEEFLRQIADNVPGLIGYLGADERYRFVNATFEEWFQRPRQQILGRTAAELIGEAEHKRLDDYRQQALTGSTVSYETQFTYPDGVTRTVWGRYQPDRAADGRILGFYLFLMDITERKKMEEALYASEARFRAVQQASPDGYMIFESVRNEQGVISDFRWLYVNPASEQMVGRPARDLVGKCLLTEMPGNREEGLFDAYVHVVETGTVYQRELCYQHEGIDRWFRNTAAKAGDGFAVTFSDITAHKEAEADRQLLSELAEQIRLADGPEELISAAVRLVGDHLRVGRCLWIEIDAAEQQGIVHAQYCRDLPPVPATYANVDYSPITRAELRAGRILVNYDAQQDPRTAAFYETTYAPCQERAYVGVPLLHEGVWRGLLSITVPEARQWQAHEIHLLETVAERVWLAIEKLRLHAEVRRVNESFTLAEAAVPGWIYDYDWRSGTVMRSDGFQRVLGYPPEECQPTAAWWQSLIHPEDWQWLVQETGPLIPDGDLRLLEYRVRDRNGHYHHIWDRARVIRNEAGAVIRIVGSSVDITERKQTEAALQQSNAILSGVLESSNDAIFVRDLNGRYLLVNNAGAEQVGLPKAAIIGRRYQEIFAPAVVAAMTADDQPVFAQGIPVTQEHVSERNGVMRYWHTLKMPLRNADGVIIGLISSARDFTERKTTEEALRASETRFRHLAEAMPQVVWTSATDGTTTYINSQWSHYSGMSLSVTLAQGMWPVIHPDDQETNRQQWRQALTNGSAYEGEVRYRRHDGVYRWFLERAIPVRDEAGVITQWFGVSMDIDDRKEAEQRQAELAALRETMLNNQQFLSDLGMDLRLLSDTETILAQLVRRLGTYLQVAGCRVNEIDLQQEQFTLQKEWVADDAPWPAVATPGVYPLAELAPPPLLTALQAGQTVVVANLVRDPRTAPVADHYETALVHSLIGVPIFYQGQWRATLSVKGHGERQWRPDEVALLESVAGQLSALLEKVRAEEALRQSEERLRLALAGGGMGIWESQVATNRSLWSPEEYALFGLPVGAEITDELFSRLVHPADLPGLQAAMQRLFSGGSDHTGEFRIIRPDGAVRWLADRVTLLRDEAGAPVRLLGINFDITERKEQEDELKELNATLEGRVRERTKALEEAIHALAITNQELAQFTTAAAHDLRTPLRGIANLVHWIREDAAAVLSPAAQRHLEKLDGRVGRLEKMLEDLLAYSRVGRVRYLPEAVDVQLLLQNLLDLLAPPPGFVVQITTPLPTFNALRIPLDLVCRNLLSNAIRHHHDPSNGLVTIGVRDLGEWYEFCISDNGPGIEPQFHDRIFGMFQTLKPRDQVEGSGIGLALVKKTVESVGGRIWMTSTPGQGTTFYFTWPKEQKGD